MSRVQLTINGKSRSVDADGDMPLLWVRRDLLGLREIAGSGLAVQHAAWGDTLANWETES